MSAYDTPSKTSTETEHATVTESATRWKGPFTEYDRYVEPTGAECVRCSACGVEVLAGDTERATHRDGCDTPASSSATRRLFFELPHMFDYV